MATHGTISRYVNQSCRCNLCRAARAEYDQKRHSANRTLRLDQKKAWREMNRAVVLQDKRRRHQARRQQCWEYLGNQCASCGARDVFFDIDHIDPATKEFGVAMRYSVAWETLKAELDKCQLLCKPCHKTKTRSERCAALTSAL